MESQEYTQPPITATQIFLVFGLGMMLGIILGMFISTLVIEFSPIQSKEHKPQIKPCITYKQFTEWQAKHDMYVDSIVIYSLKGKKQKAIGLSDSISKYQILLNGMKWQQK